ncbi:MAG: hypothetical protein JNL64_00085 [Blastocatellia bacterium]|nr:hypothetical protein [Blastocatellia bacterium]
MSTDPKNETVVRILYTNYRGETAVREVIPKHLWFGETEWHSERQWLLSAYDLEKRADRDFAVKDIRSWF